MGRTIISTLDVYRGEEVVTDWYLVETDNFGGDYPNERFIAVVRSSKEMAECFANAWNERMGENSSRILRVVEHREIIYKLQPGFEP